MPYGRNLLRPKVIELMQRDIYETLGVGRNATQEEIKRAFRRKAMECHPDRNPDNPHAEERFKELQEAYQVLSDPHERAYYDRTGRTGRQSASGPFDFGFGTNPADLFEDIFGQVFGAGMGGRRRSSRGADLRLNINIGFEEAAFGTEARIKVPRKETCAECGGSGARPGHGSSTCPLCGGTGRMQINQGFFSFTRTCRRCGGTGRIIREKCTNCAGSGLVSTIRDLTIKIPPGVSDGARLKLAGEGEGAPKGGSRGDLYVVVNVDSHPRFTRRDDDLVIEVPISFPQAALGAEIFVPTLEGEERLRISPGTQSGRIFRLRGHGVTHLGRPGRGDLHVVVHVDVPTKLTEEQKGLLRKLAELSGDEVEPKSKGFFGKVWDILG